MQSIFLDESKTSITVTISPTDQMGKYFYET